MMVKTRSPVALDKRLDDDYQRVFVGVCVCGEGWSDGVGGDGPAAGVGPGPAGGVGPGGEGWAARTPARGRASSPGLRRPCGRSVPEISMKMHGICRNMHTNMQKYARNMQKYAHKYA
jgi:hypothetical protein